MFDRICQIIYDSAPLTVPALSLMDTLPVLAVAEAAPSDFPWGSIPAAGLLGWYLWYNTRHGLPRIIEGHAKNLESMSEKWSEQVKLQREEYAENMLRLDAIRREEQGRFLASIDELNDSIRGLACQAHRLHESQHQESQ